MELSETEVKQAHPELTPAQRYKLVKEARVCPDCGRDVVPARMNSVDALEDAVYDHDHFGLKCTGADARDPRNVCNYIIFAGEHEADFK